MFDFYALSVPCSSGNPPSPGVLVVAWRRKREALEPACAGRAPVRSTSVSSVWLVATVDRPCMTADVAADLVGCSPQRSSLRGPALGCRPGGQADQSPREQQHSKGRLGQLSDWQTRAGAHERGNSGESRYGAGASTVAHAIDSYESRRTRAKLWMRRWYPRAQFICAIGVGRYCVYASPGTGGDLATDWSRGDDG